ncbi:glutamate receptor U1-like [Periplaneta americana]|uniref:glutamate receptor U1-like n=1 Tax=Periplaneta americana TaxID=6978 RepID=UPI0037E8DE5D
MYMWQHRPRCPAIPESVSSRVLIINAAIVGVVVTAAYSATLVAFQAVQTFELPFTTLEGMLADKSYTLNVLANSALLNMFEHAKESEVHQELYNHLVSSERDPLPTTTLEGLERLCEGHYTFMAEYDVVVGLLPSIPCKIVSLPYEPYVSSVAIAFEKNSTYREVINYLLFKLTNGGILKRLRGEAWWMLTNLMQSEVGFSEVRVLEITPLLVFMAVATVAAMVFLVAEKHLHKVTFKSQNYKERRGFILGSRKTSPVTLRNISSVNKRKISPVTMQHVMKTNGLYRRRFLNSKLYQNADVQLPATATTKREA